VEALVNAKPGQRAWSSRVPARVSSTVDRATWQRLLTAGGPPS
jgi:hypothetical protein